MFETFKTEIFSGCRIISVVVIRFRVKRDYESWKATTQRHYFTLITHENFTASALLTNILHVKAADTTNTAVGDKQCRWATLLATRQQRGQQDRRRKKIIQMFPGNKNFQWDLIWKEHVFKNLRGNRRHFPFPPRGGRRSATGWRFWQLLESVARDDGLHLWSTDFLPS